jgi:hypothetical protein
LQILPARLFRHKEDIISQIFVRVFGVGAFKLTFAGCKFFGANRRKNRRYI